MTVDVTMIRRAFGIAAIISLGWGVKASADDAEDRDLVRKAVAYLDDRQEAWSRFARADRGEGNDKTSCVSCHTGINYVLARPALGRFAQAPKAVAQERMLAQVSLRVEHWAELDSPRFELMYDSNDRKKAESRGTEAVINALVLARADAAQGRKEPGAATRPALGHLWATQATEGADAGSWDWLNFGYEPWEANSSRPFGAALAAVAAGSAPGYVNGPRNEQAARGLNLLRDYLRKRFATESLYNRLWIVEASMALEGVLSADNTREVGEQLRAVQQEDGGWALAALGEYRRVDGSDQARDSDGYATGLALHVLLGSGLAPTRPELARGLGWLRAHQQADGSWPGRSMNKQRDPATFIGKLMTDAATAFAALALVEADSR